METTTVLTPQTTPIKLDLKKDKALTIQWQDGVESVYPISLLRTMCPCATCKAVREEQQPKRSLLRILPGNFSEPIVATGAQMVGNYAMRIDWSDGHSSGIYSFQYLRDIAT
jgi:DUF971 family protein